VLASRFGVRRVAAVFPRLKTAYDWHSAHAAHAAHPAHLDADPDRPVAAPRWGEQPQ